MALNDGSCIRLRPEYPGHVWAYDFVEGRTHDGRKFRILTIIDEASRECLALTVARRLNHEDVLASLADLFVERGPPAHIRSDNGIEFIATAVQEWLGKVGVRTLYICAGLTMGKRLQRELQRLAARRTAQWRNLYSLAEAKVLIEAWRRHYNTVRAAQQPGLPAPAGTGAARPPLPASGAASLPPTRRMGGGGDDALTINP